MNVVDFTSNKRKVNDSTLSIVKKLKYENICKLCNIFKPKYYYETPKGIVCLDCASIMKLYIISNPSLKSNECNNVFCGDGFGCIC